MVSFSGRSVSRVVFVLLSLVFALAACTSEEVIALFIADETETERSSYGVGLLERSFRVRVDEVVRTKIYLPLEPGSDGLADGDFPVVLSIHGGLVTPTQYEWMNLHMASRGYVVVAPSHDFDLAIFEQGNAADVLSALRRASKRSGDSLQGRVRQGPVLAIGHSLGGVIAARTWLDVADEVTHLVLLSSLPNPADDVEWRDDSRAFVLSLTGSLDGRITVDEVVEGAQRFTAPTTIAVIEGMNHFQWVDAPTREQWESDRAATIDVMEARRLALSMIDEALEAFRTGDRSFFDNPALWPTGVVAHEQ
jgi:dienelactone hydrolase